MPEPPSVSIITRYLFENPYPAGIVLLAVAGGLVWTGLTQGRRDRLRIAAVPGGLGVAILLIGLLVTTSGERAKRVSRQLVDAAVDGDLVTAFGLFADDASVSMGSPNNPGYDIEFIRSALDDFVGRYTVEDNSITMLDAFTESADRAEVHMACFTTVTQGYGGPTPSQWVLTVTRQADGAWKITRITCVSVAGQHPPRPW